VPALAKGAANRRPGAVPSPPLGPADYNDLGNRFLAARDYEKAGAAFYECLKREPALAGAALGLAAASRELGKLDIAVKVLETALRFNPQDIRLLVTLGAALQESGAAPRAVEILEQAVAADPASFEAAFNFGNTLQALDRLVEAEAQFRRALALRPRDSDAHHNLQKVLMERGDVVGLERALRQALAIEPANLIWIRLLLFVLVYVPDRSPAEIHHIARQAVAALDTPPPVAAPRPAGAHRPLRIGFLSGDLRNHPVGRNLIPLVERLDRGALELVFFSDTPKADFVTDRFRACARGWHETRELSDAEVAERIRAQGIDILVIVAARFDENRVFFGLHRAAPVQIALHDLAPSALPHIDYLVLDRFTVPRRAMAEFSERVLRLPSFYTHEPIADAPAIGPLPMTASGTVTFGCLNNPFKLNERTLDLWARLMTEIPGSRLILAYKTSYTASHRQERILAPFLRHGVARDRVVLQTEMRGTADYLGLYNAIDLALDPFPFSGSTTSFESLWMGVPVVTRAGETPASRWTGSMLHALKLDDCIAETDDSWIAAVRRWTDRPDDLAALRRTLRERVAVSPLCDGGLRARQMSRLFQAVWRRATPRTPGSR
jgi:protein O-GlcNAc transferase